MRGDSSTVHVSVGDTIVAGSHSVDVVDFRSRLVVWSQQHFRLFPWRLIRDPYRILIAEVLLHRTQAKQVTPVYEQFIRRFPDVGSLAAAARDDVCDALRSLGLRWRADLLFDMSTELVDRFGGEVPQAKDELKSLPGVSDYIASAVRCFAWDFTEALIDTNTVRIAGRLFDLEVRESSRRNRVFTLLIQSLVDPARPREYNFALLDLAGQVCMKKQPRHDQCPVLDCCAYGLVETQRLSRECEDG